MLLTSVNWSFVYWDKSYSVNSLGERLSISFEELVHMIFWMALAAGAVAGLIALVRWTIEPWQKKRRKATCEITHEMIAERAMGIAAMILVTGVFVSQIEPSIESTRWMWSNIFRRITCTLCWTVLRTIWICLAIVLAGVVIYWLYQLLRWMIVPLRRNRSPE